MGVFDKKNPIDKMRAEFQEKFERAKKTHRKQCQKKVEQSMVSRWESERKIYQNEIIELKDWINALEIENAKHYAQIKAFYTKSINDLEKDYKIKIEIRDKELKRKEASLERYRKELIKKEEILDRKIAVAKSSRHKFDLATDRLRMDLADAKLASDDLDVLNKKKTIQKGI